MTEPLQLATVTNYESMVEAFRAAKDLRGLSNAHCDELANLAAGHTDAILGPTGRKNFGPLSFNAFCWAFAVKFVMVIDPEREKEMQEYWADRQRECSHVRLSASRISRILIERAKPAIYRAQMAAARAARNQKLSPEQRSAIARKAGLAKQKKWRLQRRQQRQAERVTG
jgi:hypothetical protein